MRHKLFVFSLLFLAPIYAEGFKAGATRVDITPPVGLQLMGFADRTAPSTGVLDPLHARILVLETAQERLAIVTLDVCRVFGPWWIDALRERVKTSSGISHVLVIATHTHSAPVIGDEENKASSWERETLDKVSKAILAAHQQAVEAQLGVGYGSVDAGYNRRTMRAGGKVEMIWENPQRRHMGPVDRTVAVLRIDDKQGRPIAILINHALHPVVFGVRGLSYSADFVGPLTASVESSFGGATVCLFVQGACGDINPYHADVPPEQDPPGKRDWTAGVIAKEAVRVANEIRTSTPEHPMLQVMEDTLNFHGRWTAAAKTDFRLPVSAILINRQIALMSMPGEPFVEFQTRWRDACPVADCLFAGYWNMILDETGGPWMTSEIHGNPDPNVQQPIVVVNRQTKKVDYLAVYYYLAHFSKFVRPGAVRVALSGNEDKIRALAFRVPEGGLVLQLLNRRDTPATVTVAWRDQVLKAELPALSIGTYQWSAK